MAERKVEVRTLLFDRLVDRDPKLRHEVRPMRTLDRRGLKESVRRDLELLLNTRCPLPAHRIPPRDGSVVDYGIPDFTALSPARFEDRGKLAEAMVRAINAFEPRLAEVQVRLDPVAGNEKSLAATIEAKLMVGRVAEPVSFATLLQLGDGAVEVFVAD